MKTKIASQKKPLHRKTLVISAAFFFCISFASLLWLEKSGHINFFHTKSSLPTITQLDDTKAQTTSKQPSAQSSFSAGTPRKEPAQSSLNEGAITDTKGTATAQTPENMWSRSPDNKSITVYAPTQNQVLEDGQILSGASTADVINFRLIDDVSGVIAQGSLDVIDGRFSGVFRFQTSGSGGRVDVFTTDTDGAEKNNIYIPVRFTQ